jgi:DNA-binding XRE family transcriptional regulator
LNRREIIEERNRLDSRIQDLLKKMEKAYKPQAIKSGTSYEDYDTIPGGNKELDFVKVIKEFNKLVMLRDIYNDMLANYDDVDEEEILKHLKGNVDKVKFLRIVREHTQLYVAEKIGINIRTVQRIEKSIKEVDVNKC